MLYQKSWKCYTSSTKRYLPIAIDPETDRALSEFTQKFNTYFRQRFSKKVLESAREMMQKDLQDMATIAEGNTAEEVAKNPFLFPQCMISKSTLVRFYFIPNII